MSDERPDLTRPAIRYRDDVQPGDPIDGFSMNLDRTAMVLQVQDSQDWNVIHHDPDYARDSGHGGIFYNTGWTGGMLGRALSDWVCKLSFQMRAMNCHGDTVTVKGVVADKPVDDAGRHLVNIDIWIENERVGKTTPASATVQLPGRKRSSDQAMARHLITVTHGLGLAKLRK